MKFKTFLLFGAPGAGKGTQGRIIGSIPGFFHLACGDVFRSLDLRSDIGRLFLEYSSRGSLVPDDLTIKLWRQTIDNMVVMGRFKPDIDHLVLDGIPRNLTQAQMLEEHLDVKKIFHLSCPHMDKLVERMKRRALKENRLDDANEATIRTRLETYEKETSPVLNFYGQHRVAEMDATLWPYQVLRDILSHVQTD